MVYWGCMNNKPFIIHPSPASHQDAKTLEKRRLKAGALFEKGIRQAQVARRLKVSRVAVHYWYIMWEKKGKEGLRSGRPGPKSRFNGEKISKIRETLLKGAGAAGYNTELWTLARVADMIRRRTRIRIGQTHAWRILRAMGWSNQKPETRYRDRNEAAIKQWKQNRWPAIQKKGSKRMPA